MIINLDEIKKLLDTEAVLTLHRATGVSRNAIYGYRNGTRKFENFSLKTVKKLQEFINNKKRFEQ